MALPLGDMMAVTQLIYSSRNKSVAQDRAQLTMLRTILTVSQRNNVRDGLTGFLIFDRVHFFQILEGDS
ncbi:MAG TPA: BLUF domain-containing protein, partial [Enterovirga sp.]